MINHTTTTDDTTAAYDADVIVTEAISKLAGIDSTRVIDQIGGIDGLKDADDDEIREIVEEQGWIGSDVADQIVAIAQIVRATFDRAIFDYVEGEE